MRRVDGAVTPTVAELAFGEPSVSDLYRPTPVEREPDQERPRIGRDRLIRLVGDGEVGGRVSLDATATQYLPEVSENAELVRAWQEAANRGRVDDLLALSHPEFEMTEAGALPGAARITGLEALRRYCRGWLKIWSEWEWREEELIELPPDRVVLDATLRLRGLRSSIWVEHRWVYVFAIRDGLILRNDGFLTKEEALDNAASQSAVE
jgi:ketosteroid isomerase-like protein